MSAAIRPWLFNEFAHPGVDHADPAYPAQYETNMRRFRDFDKEAAAILAMLDISADHLVVDIGAGTGAFAVPGARGCRRMIAVDASRAMLDFAAAKARAAGLGNIEFVHAGFLTYRHAGEPANVVVSCMALHHLPDFWKTAALRNVNSMLKPGGRFLLSDVVFSFPINAYERELDAMVTGMEQTAGKQLADEAAVHCREEFSTFDWILELILERTGFTVRDKKIASPTRIDYICVKDA